MPKPKVPKPMRRSVWSMLRDGIKPDMVAFHTGINLNAIKRMHHFLRSKQGQQYVQPAQGLKDA